MTPLVTCLVLCAQKFPTNAILYDAQKPGYFPYQTFFMKITKTYGIIILHLTNAQAVWNINVT